MEEVPQDPETLETAFPDAEHAESFHDNAFGDDLGDHAFDSITPPFGTDAFSDPADVATKRDRIVVLGRRQSGKTVFLSMLYYMLWQNRGPIELKALDGSTHQICIETVESMRRGEWPSSTSGSHYFHFEARYCGRSWPMVLLDYPGEVFTKAFVQNTSTPDVAELLEHIDRAIAVLILADPAIASGDDLSVASEDQFGLQRALQRIHGAPNGKRVPVSFVLTKYDQRRDMIKLHGGLSEFVKSHYSQILRENKMLQVFRASAVQERDGQPVLGGGLKPRGVVEPLKHLLDLLVDQAKVDEKQLAIEAGYRERQRQYADEIESRRRSMLFWVYFWSAFVVLFVVIGVVTVLVVKPWN